MTTVVISRIQNRRGTQADFDSLYTTYPGTGTQILQPGELALCTDTRRIFLGNLNGEYVELAVPTGLDKISLLPLVISLTPQASFTVIPQLQYFSTPFFTLLYSLVNTVTLDPNVVGASFSKNGELKITAVTNFVPAPAIPPFPPLLPVTLSDTGTEVNTTAFDISFEANYDISGTIIEISYKHNFPSNLTFSTSSIVWAPL